MTSELPIITIDPEVERALEIVVHYLERKYSVVHPSTVERAVLEICKLYRKDVRHPLLLANRALSVIENLRPQHKAA